MSRGVLQTIYEEMLAGKTVEVEVINQNEAQTVLSRLRVIKSRYDAKTEAMFGDRVSEGKIIEYKTVSVEEDFKIVTKLQLKLVIAPSQRYSYKIVDVSPTPETPT